MPGNGTRALLTGTLVAETAGETLLGLGLLALALAHRRRPGRLARRPDRRCSSPPRVLTLTGVGPARPPPREGPPLRRAREDRLRGAQVTRGPTRATCCRGSCSAASLRLAALGCFLAAFHLPATFAAVLLVTFAQCSGRLVPFSPASVGAGAAILAASLRPGDRRQYVPAEQLAAFFVGTSTVLTVVGTALALILCATQASANARPKLAGVGRLTRIRAAISTRP